MELNIMSWLLPNFPEPTTLPDIFILAWFSMRLFFNDSNTTCMRHSKFNILTSNIGNTPKNVQTYYSVDKFWQQKEIPGRKAKYVTVDKEKLIQ